MTIAIIGTRGIPNHYGGFEQFAEIFSAYAVEQGHIVIVYNTHNHPYQKANYKGVKIIHRYNPEKFFSSFGQFIYDLNCIVDLKRQNPDVILQLGYTSSSVWGWLLPKNVPVFTNMDGLEWKRQKYNNLTKRFLKQAEKWAVKTSNYLIADSLGIKDYLEKKYDRQAVFIAYGAETFDSPDFFVLEQLDLKPYQYNMLIARMEPENNIETILESVVKSKKNMDFLVVGSYQNTTFGNMMYKRYSNCKHIKFLGAIYDQKTLNNLRYYANLYCHGHSVGGTNPSLLEAMGSQALIVAHDNIFNRSVLENNGFYFSDSQTLTTVLDTIIKNEQHDKVSNNLKKINEQYNWSLINQQYLGLLTQK